MKEWLLLRKPMVILNKNGGNIRWKTERGCMRCNVNFWHVLAGQGSRSADLQTGLRAV